MTPEQLQKKLVDNLTAFIPPNASAAQQEEFFAWQYGMLAAHCFADAPLGAEYRRVLCAWEAAGRPCPAVEFIVRLANVPPPESRSSPAEENADNPPIARQPNPGGSTDAKIDPSRRGT